MNIKQRSFEVAAFAMDGGCEGSGFWDESRFSPDLVSILSDFLCKQGEAFSSPLEGGLRHVSLQFTSASSAAIASFYVNESLAASALLLLGVDVVADNSVMDTFIASVRRSSMSLLGSHSVDAFDEIRHFCNRPFLAVVAWASDAINDEDYALVQELCLHLGAVFLLR
ncbi:hypothetical protein [Lacipirellula parvula]|nr:hypothetical protein [Lacipirellula parvula]